MKILINCRIIQRINNILNFYKILNNKYGYWDSQIDKIPKNAKGYFLPWYTYPCIEYLDNLNLEDLSVFEYGSGYSTIFWSKKCRKVYSVEHDKVWFKRIKKLCRYNIIIKYVEKADFVSSISRINNTFDVIIIDGIYRYSCAVQALKHLKETGFIILDNSDWHPNTVNFLLSKGLSAIDFCGFGPINNYSWCTSIFFRKLNLKYKRSINPVKGWASIEGGNFESDNPLR